jgi:O-antigen/teichoic acid export membrane protein
MSGEVFTQEPTAPAVGTARRGTGLLRQLRTRALSRMGWGLADQAVSSLTNVAVSFYLVHILAPQAFGAFSLAFISYGFALNASRGLSTDPLMVRYSGVEVKRWRRAVGGATGTAITVGLVCGIVAIAASIAFGGVTGAAFLALGLTLPGLMLQDSWRYSFFAAGRGFHAFLNDTIWALLMAPFIVILRLTGHASVFWVLFAWGASAAGAAAVGPFQARVIPWVTHTWFWLHLHRDLGPRYLAEGTIGNSGIQVRGYSLTLILGLSTLAYFQAANTLFGPVNIVYTALGLVTIPEAARVLRRSPTKLPLFCITIGSGMAALGLAWGVVLLIALPKGLGGVMLGPIWRPTYPLVFPLVVSAVGSGLSCGTGAGLHALGAARKSLRSVALGTVIFVAFSLAGAALGGAVGTCWGTAAAMWTSSVMFWLQLYSAMREANISTPGIMRRRLRHARRRD